MAVGSEGAAVWVYSKKCHFQEQILAISAYTSPNDAPDNEIVHWNFEKLAQSYFEDVIDSVHQIGF